MAAARRLKMQIYADILRAIHSSRRNGSPPTLFQIQRTAGLTYNRLKPALDELRRLGLLDGSLTVTAKGYSFLQDVGCKVFPVMEKYGLWNQSL